MLLHQNVLSLHHYVPLVHQNVLLNINTHVLLIQSNDSVRLTGYIRPMQKNQNNVL